MNEIRYEAPKTLRAAVALLAGANGRGRVLAGAKGLHALQRKFLEHAALQCGICTPGILIAARSLLERDPDPSEEEERYWLAGNLGRCTGYHKIVEAVFDAAREMRGG